MFRSTVPRAEARAPYIDWMRGIAVLLMIEAHTLDAWTRPASRSSLPFSYALMASGFAAPLFLWLAGLAIPLFAASRVRRGRSRRQAVDMVCRRGLEIFILAFLFRLQAFVLSPGAHPITLFRVDILNIMGPAIVACGVAWLAFESTTGLVVVYSVMSVAVAMATPIVRTAAVLSALPVWMQWYVRPAAENTTFTAFPWIGFTFAGAALGAVICKARDRADRQTLFAVVGMGGAALIGFGFFAASLPSIYAEASFWTTSPTYFAIRTGAMMVALAIMYGVGELFASGGRVGSVLARLGRSSLFVYWIHVELVYGYASWALRRRLPLWGTAIGYVLFAMLVYAAVVWRDRIAGTWQAQKKQITFQYKAETV